MGLTAPNEPPDADTSPMSDDWDRSDAAILVSLVLVSLGLYCPLALRLAHGIYLDYYNLAFDFDPIRTVETLTANPPDFQNVKHPLVVLLRPLAWPFLSAGLTGKEASVLVMTGFGAGTLALCYVFLRRGPIERPLALALSLLFMVTGSQIFTSIIAETYGVAGFTIALTWVIAQARLRDDQAYGWLRYVAGVMTFGTTVTNVAQTFVAELLIAWRARGFTAAIVHCIKFGLILAIPIVVLSVAIWHEALWAELQDPVLALKHVYWQQTYGARTGAGQVVLTFFTFSFVSPHYSWLMLPEGINMRDFRTYAFSDAGSVAAPLWLAFCACGAIAGLCHRQYRPVALGLACALAVNLLFHLRFQFRGSLYIYSAHMNFLIFALACGAAPWLTVRRNSGKAYLGLVLLLAMLVGANNLPIARTFAASFDRFDAACAAPCKDRVGQ